jgi:hypothetical protein
LKVLSRLNIELLVQPTDEVQKHKYKLSA